MNSEIEKEIIKDKINGLSDQEIGNKYNVNLKYIEKTITKNLGINVSLSNPKKQIKNFHPKDFNLEQNTVWSFKSRGNWATHNGDYRGNWSPYVPRNVILRYSQENDLVLDYFCGSGTTGVECKLLNRKFIGIDINEKAITLAKENIEFQYLFSPDIRLEVGDARNLNFIENNSIDLICAHPPYANIINYSFNDKNDLSFFEYNEFLNEMEKVAKESFRVLKEGKYCAILIGDMRKNKNVIPLGFEVIETYLKAGFKLKELVIKRQHNCKTSGFWYKNSIKFNFLLLAHEYLAIFVKSDNSYEENPELKPVKTEFNFIQEINYETTTVWNFEEDNWLDLTLTNLIKRYGEVSYSVFNSNQNQNPSDLLIYFYDNNYDEFLTKYKEYLTKDGLLAIICEDIRLKNHNIESIPLKIKNSIKDLTLKEIIVININLNIPEYLKNIENDLYINHKYILLYKVM